MPDTTTRDDIALAREQIRNLVTYGPDEPGELKAALDGLQAAVLRAAADIVAEMCTKTDVNVAAYDRYDFRQRVALRDAERELQRRAADAAKEAGR